MDQGKVENDDYYAYFVVGSNLAFDGSIALKKSPARKIELLPCRPNIIIYKTHSTWMTQIGIEIFIDGNELYF